MGANVKSSKGGRSTETSNSIPSELRQFVQRNTYSLLIKGSAGTGKTTLSLTILRALRVKSNFFYISTRISPKQLFVYYPWLGKFVGRPKISESDEMSGQGYNLSSFEDARLDEPESLFERITNQLMDVKAPIIIIDSWDAIASFMDKEARLNNERVLQIWRERAGAKLIFINEDPNDTTLDFLVDGIVHLERKYYGDVMVRQILLSKLRGIMINRSTYIYSLNNGIFRSYDAYRPYDFDITTSQARLYEAENPLLSISEEGYITSGHKVLDKILGGGYMRKKLVLIDIESNVNMSVIMAFLYPIMSNFVLSNNPILFHPFDGMDSNDVISYLKIEDLNMHQNWLINISCHLRKTDGKSDQNLVQTEDYDNPKEYFDYLQNVVIKTRQQYPNKFLLCIMGTRISHKITKYAETSEMDIFRFIRANTDLTLIVSGNPQNTSHYVSEMCDVHMKFTTLKGSLFLQILMPKPSLYAVLPPASPSSPTIRLDPVV